ncbi:MAG: hypothetical protein BGP24_02645 [Lysobacterales bacterium 69-70]|nr:hypothetical protein [Xanthomonadaceae bacterium]ODU31937.1 MAG: hypothetical protein ABS97_16910 [Xanthomonadaceae bacterium SCN 69-320]ODV19994.1 MAG: hypothetical protein ABT27_08835 [Xanthomonadaceae bacterium SCN 69-25]OJZ01662.1 MAG: hypothetical protein BGP24_02645 [Xanthomonadales bacterium 69-70]
MPITNSRLRRHGAALLLALPALLPAACRFVPNTPQEYFGRAALNANAVAAFGSAWFRVHDCSNPPASTPAAFNSCEKLLQNSVSQLENSIERADALYRTDETRPMIEAGLDLYRFVLDSYRTDHLQVARLLDAKAPAAQVEQALHALDAKSYAGFEQRYDKVWGIAEPYAKAHGIKLITTQTSPRPR